MPPGGAEYHDSPLTGMSTVQCIYSSVSKASLQKTRVLLNSAGDFREFSPKKFENGAVGDFQQLEKPAMRSHSPWADGIVVSAGTTLLKGLTVDVNKPPAADFDERWSAIFAFAPTTDTAQRGLDVR
jgi:hypothetical protein